MAACRYWSSSSRTGTARLFLVLGNCSFVKDIEFCQRYCYFRIPAKVKIEPRQNQLLYLSLRELTPYKLVIFQLKDCCVVPTLIFEYKKYKYFPNDTSTVTKI